jgi:FkbM family methyltransferase
MPDTTEEEVYFFNCIKDNINVIFDVGIGEDSIYTEFTGEVHYFEPDPRHFDKFKIQPNKNSKSFFNDFGLSNKNEDLTYYPKTGSFFYRTSSLKWDGLYDGQKVLPLKKASEYIDSTKITAIDFLKIDVEGYEYNTLLGFEDHLHKVKIIQFEYGGCYIDAGVNLIDLIRLLNKYNFTKFYRLVRGGWIQMTDFTDDFQYCNIVCVNNSYNISLD